MDPNKDAPTQASEDRKKGVLLHTKDPYSNFACKVPATSKYFESSLASFEAS